MKRISFFLLSQFIVITSMAQCSICTKTAAQIGQEAGKGFNAGILYLAAMPFAIIGYVAIKWWKQEKQ
ncbi:MAG: hypothetical protein WCJ68_08460 [Chitinophagia bacterium]|jgi:hypothetical protein